MPTTPDQDPPPMARYDVFGVGNALVDIQAKIDDSMLGELGIEKGIMTLVDDDRQAAVLGSLASHSLHRCAGGSAANTIVATADFGGDAAYVGKVGNDEVGKTKITVEVPSAPVVLLDLQGELDATTLPGPCFDRLQQRAADSLATAFRHHGQVMDIEQRARLKGGKCQETNRQTDRLVVAECQHHRGGGVLTQGGNQPLPHLNLQRLTTANRIGGVGIEHPQDPRAMRGIGEVHVSNFKIPKRPFHIPSPCWPRCGSARSCHDKHERPRSMCLFYPRPLFIHFDQSGDPAWHPGIVSEPTGWSQIFPSMASGKREPGHGGVMGYLEGNSRVKLLGNEVSG